MSCGYDPRGRALWFWTFSLVRSFDIDVIFYHWRKTSTDGFAVPVFGCLFLFPSASERSVLISILNLSEAFRNCDRNDPGPNLLTINMLYPPHNQAQNRSKKSPQRTKEYYNMLSGL